MWLLYRPADQKRFMESFEESNASAELCVVYVGGYFRIVWGEENREKAKYFTQILM